MVRQLWHVRFLVEPVRSRLWAALVVAAIGAGAGVAGFCLLAGAIGALLSGSSPGWWIAAALLAVVLRFSLRTLSFRLSHIASYNLETVLRRQLTDHLALLPLGVVQSIGSGQVKKIVQDDVRSLHGLVADAVPLAGVALATPVVAVVAMFIADWRLAFVSLITVPFVCLTMWLTGRPHEGRRDRYDRANSAVNAAVVEFAQGMPVVRTFDDGTTTFARFHGRVNEFTTAIIEWNAVSRNPALLTRTAIAPLPTLFLIVVAGFSIFMYGEQPASTTDLATFALFLFVGTTVVEAFLPIMWLGHYLSEARAAALRIADLLRTPVLPTAATPADPADSSVRFVDVSFSYDDSRPALTSVSFEVRPGHVCAIVGPSGAGKSTIARLTPRFWDVDEGAVLIGGVDVRDIPSCLLLRQFALVFQEPFLMADTIAANIRLGQPDASDAEVREAARAARIHDFVNGLPLGYQTPVGELGGRLSGGQRQRIALARAILLDAPIVILDEATAFTDPENAALIHEALAELTRDKTMLVIAHRLGSIVEADQIVVLEGGCVVERGTHSTLLAAQGTYARLWSADQTARVWTLEASR